MFEKCFFSKDANNVLKNSPSPQMKFEGPKCYVVDPPIDFYCVFKKKLIRQWRVTVLTFHCLIDHLWSGAHLGLEIDADEQTILKYILEYVLNCSSQMKSKSMGLFLNKSMI